MDHRMKILSKMHERPVQYHMSRFSSRQLISMRNVVSSHRDLVVNIKISASLELMRRGWTGHMNNYMERSPGNRRDEKELPMELYVEVFQIRR